MKRFYGMWVLQGPRRAVLGIWPSGPELNVAVGWSSDGAAQQTAQSIPLDAAFQDEALVVGDTTARLLEDGRLEMIGQGQRAVYERGRVKQVLVYRRDLKMRKGKIAAQCAHASLSIFTRGQRQRGLELRRTLTPEMALWTQWRQAKIVLSVQDEEALTRVHEMAQQAGLPTSLIRDAGLTEFGGVPTLTAVAVGPALERDIDRITKSEDGVPTKLA